MGVSPMSPLLQGMGETPMLRQDQGEPHVPHNAARIATLAAAITLATSSLLFSATPSTRPSTRGAARTQQACLPEKDPSSPRRTHLKSDKPDDEIIRIDVDNDGDPDILERWFHGKRVRWIDENDDMLA